MWVPKWIDVLHNTQCSFVLCRPTSLSGPVDLSLYVPIYLSWLPLCHFPSNPLSIHRYPPATYLVAVMSITHHSSPYFCFWMFDIFTFQHTHGSSFSQKALLNVHGKMKINSGYWNAKHNFSLQMTLESSVLSRSKQEAQTLVRAFLSFSLDSKSCVSLTCWRNWNIIGARKHKYRRYEDVGQQCWICVNRPRINGPWIWFQLILLLLLTSDIPTQQHSP